jgi:hypothetical protein
MAFNHSGDNSNYFKDSASIKLYFITIVFDFLSLFVESQSLTLEVSRTFRGNGGRPQNQIKMMNGQNSSIRALTEVATETLYTVNSDLVE